MYLRPKDGEPPRRVILSDKERDAVLTEVHAGHFGGKRLMGKIYQRFFWHGIVKDVEDWVKQDFCLSVHLKHLVVLVDTQFESTHYFNLL